MSIFVLLRRVRERLSCKRRMCQVVDESSLPAAAAAAVEREVVVVRGARGRRVLRRNLRNGRRNRRRRGVLGRAVKPPFKLVWSAFNFMCIYSPDRSAVTHDDARIWFRINPTFEDRNFLMVQDSIRFGILM